MSKSADAFRTISEVAEWLETPAHVLRFWESKFTQVKPVKRAGGRRYYRPADMRLLGGIKKLLHEDGMTIKGVQKILREQGIKHVSSLCTLSMADEDESDAALIEAVPASEPVDTVVPFTKPEPQDEPAADAEPGEAEAVPDPVPEDVAGPIVEPEADAEPAPEPEPEISDTEPLEAPATVQEEPVQPPRVDVAFDAPDVEPATEPEPEVAAEVEPAEPVAAAREPDPEPAESPTADAAALPAFLQRSMEDRRAEESESPAEEIATEAEVAPIPASEPAEPVPGTLTHLSRISRLTPDAARQIAPILERLKQVAG